MLVKLDDEARTAKLVIHAEEVLEVLQEEELTKQGYGWNG